MEGAVETVTEGRSGNPVIPSRMRWVSQLKVIPDGGTLGECRIEEDETRTAACVSVRNADAVTIILAAATNYVNWHDISGDPGLQVAKRMAAAQMSYAELRERHVKDWQPLFLKCKLDLGGHEAAAEDTTTRLDKLRRGVADPLFEAQYFQYGRYLLAGRLAARRHSLSTTTMCGWRVERNDGMAAGR